jgi:type I restriction enzyme S subunit
MDKAGTSTIPDLNHNDFYSLSIPLPPTINEQKAIARVLTDTDALIQALEKKIAKKKLIKKGMMQKLLTPKEDWEVKTLGDFLDYEQPTNYVVESTEYNDNYDIPVLTAGKSFILGYTNEKDGIFENYPVIIFDDFTTATKFVDFPFKVKSSALKILKPKNKDVILGFIFEIMQQINFPLGDHKRHWISEFQPLEIMVPKSKNEQIYIAQILADMGQEIAQLEEKLSKYQLAKQGMMQQLLSGKTRLL